MANILVVGGYSPTESEANDVADFGRCLGREVVRQGHILINACLTDFDRETAEGAAEELEDDQIKNRIRTWVDKNVGRAHEIGQLLNSDIPNWDPAVGIEVPEPIESADVVIFVRGFDGVNRAALWADSRQKTILPVASFGGVSSKLYRRELGLLEQRFNGRITTDDFVILNEVADDRQDS